jgi:hypothetical protein
MFTVKRAGAVAAMLGLVAIGVAAMPAKAQAWWRGGWHPGWHPGWCCGVHVGVWIPPLVVAPGPAYVAPAYAPPVYYGPPRRAWIPAHYRGPYGIPGHWASRAAIPPAGATRDDPPRRRRAGMQPAPPPARRPTVLDTVRPPL